MTEAPYNGADWDGHNGNPVLSPKWDRSGTASTIGWRKRSATQPIYTSPTGKGIQAATGTLDRLPHVAAAGPQIHGPSESEGAALSSIARVAGYPLLHQAYELFCQRLVRERLYDAACFLPSEEERGRDGWYAEPSDELTFPYFAASLKGHVAVLVGQDG